MKPRYNNARLERGMALALFTLSLPVMLGLTVIAVDLGNLYLTRDKLNLLNRSAAATAVNIRALQGWAPFACTGTDESLGYNIGYKCAEAARQEAPQGDKYGDLVGEIGKTISSQIKASFSDAVTGSGETIKTNNLVEYGIPSQSGAITWTKDLTPSAPVYNLKHDKFQLRVRYAAKTILISRLASLLKIDVPTLCSHPAGVDDSNERCWVTSSEIITNSATTKARVIMLLDTSGSMKTREQALKAAAGAFVDYFNPNKDEIGIVSYGTAVKADGQRSLSLFSPGSATTTAGRLPIKDFINGLKIGGQTNPCDALIESAGMIDTANQGNQSETSRVFVVLFTDGAPNVYRLRFCKSETSASKVACDQPDKLAEVSGTNDWYGWTVKWGRRETYPAGSNGNPVYNSPQIKDKSGGVTFDTSPSSPSSPNNFRINEKGQFMVKSGASTWCNMEAPASECGPGLPNLDPYSKMPYSRVFRAFANPADNNYLWNGPSYLVNRDVASPAALASSPNLIDRVDPTKFKTCGIPNVKGSPSTNPDQFNYNHSLYFASRVLDTQWSLTRPLFTTIQQRHAVHLVQPPIGSPLAIRTAFPYPPVSLTVPFYASDSSPGAAPTFVSSPAPPAGCLDALDAQIPVKDSGVKLFVGAGRSSFWSNTNAASIGAVGEIIKTAELPYYCAIRTADYLRKNKNTTVFAVGLGQGAHMLYGQGCEDPMQNALDFDSRKDAFLRRLAMAPEAINFKNNNTTSLEGATWRSGVDFNLRKQDIRGCGSHPLQNQTVYLGFSETCRTDNAAPEGIPIAPDGSCKNPVGLGAAASSFSPNAIGGYYPTTSTDKLKAQFGAVAKQILFRISL
jgi:hypothetical protein